MTREVFIGFDSAWAGNPRQPGAIAAVTIEDGKASTFTSPLLTGFDDALTFIRTSVETADYVLVALDQPTLVPNTTGCRPVERVAGSLVNRLKGGVQPANRGKAAMFGDRAPIWSFLDALGARENPEVARSSKAGLFLIEVFPALALPALIEPIISRGRAAKYNPAVRAQFEPTDWRLVAEGVASRAEALGLSPLASWALQAAEFTNLRKSDQDMLDAAVCTLLAAMWKYVERSQMMVLGDGKRGYMVTPVSTATRPILVTAAAKNNVGVDTRWPEDARRSVEPQASSVVDSPDPLLRRITHERDKLGGKGCIRGMRIAVQHVLEMLAGGMSPEEILADFPDLEFDDIRAACAYGALLASNKKVS